jgi:hypothetical protein
MVIDRSRTSPRRGSGVSIWQVTGDGQASAFEGWALLATYAILAVSTLWA